MLESAYKNTGFVNFIFESIARIAVRLRQYLEFAISSCCHRLGMLESAYKNKGLVDFCSFEPGITLVCRTSACGMLESQRNYNGLVNHC